jgi:hypothetical protein
MPQVGAGEHIPTITSPFPFLFATMLNREPLPHVTGVTIASLGTRRNIDQRRRTPSQRSSQNTPSGHTARHTKEAGRETPTTGGLPVRGMAPPP